MFLSSICLAAILYTVKVNAVNGMVCGQRDGLTYTLCKEQIEIFLKTGIAVLPNIILEDEMGPIEKIYTQYMTEGSSEIQGKDFCGNDVLVFTFYN